MISWTPSHGEYVGWWLAMSAWSQFYTDYLLRLGLGATLLLEYKTQSPNETKYTIKALLSYERYLTQ